MCSEPVYIYGTDASTARIQGLGKQGAKVEVTPPTYSPNGSLTKVLYPILSLLGSLGLGVLVCWGWVMPLPWNQVKID